VVKLLRAYGE